MELETKKGGDIMIDVIQKFAIPAFNAGQDSHVLGLLGTITCCYKDSFGFVYCCRQPT
jgi:hypothetical protein